MARFLVTGATGVLGRYVVQVARERGHDVLEGSRKGGGGRTVIDVLNEDMVRGACAGVDAVIHCAADPFGKAAAVEVTGLQNLVRYANGARIVYPSIVGCDKVEFAYYKVKRKAEAALARANVDHVIVRLTQFHEFADRLARLPVPMAFVGMRAQTIAASEAAAIVVDQAEGDAQGNVGDFGGPEVHRMVDLIRQRLKADGKRRPILRVPVGTKGFKAGYNLCEDRKVGKVTWAEHLAATS